MSSKKRGGGSKSKGKTAAKNAGFSKCYPIENVPGLVVRVAPAGGKKDSTPLTITLEHLKVLDRICRRGILGLSPPIDKERLAQRVLEGHTPRPHERQLIADMLRGKRRRAVRPKSTDVALKHDEIAQHVIYAQALNPNWTLETVVRRVRELHKVSRAFVFQVLREMDPARRSIMERGAATIAEIFGGTRIRFASKSTEVQT
jgi:hypothetical protein